ncbi:MarR family winged helix-turn-helix transcriptional regulator [Bacillus sp. V5-8f]|uniref:MarR family winged helix-turn-helix transcriptional regulator n=1 Tax=Bacillus sp. V5-8f TaxID=2053044 RepID=UPI000C780CA5|nr:MarR family transcriptional regulator [Bacillus sp. V5-8f]PLT32221.1 MarR family transcriptional regulator [Bacillus sp. V5-8f]
MRRLEIEWDVTNEIEMSFFRIRKKLRTVVEKSLHPFGLTPPQFYILMILRKSGTVRVTHLAEHMNVKPSAITVLIDQLVKLEYVKRSHSDEDRRVVMLEIEGKGLELFNEVLRSHNEWIKEYFLYFEAAEIIDFWTKLKKFEKAVDSMIDKNE